MSISFHERPGVYTDYEASSIAAVKNTRRVIAVIGVSAAQSGLYTVTSYASAKQTFSEDSELAKMLKLAYLNGAGTVLAYSLANGTAADYEAAFAAVMAEKKASYLVIASQELSVQQAMREAVESASAQKGECIAFCGMETTDAAALTARAEALNSERVVLLGPSVYMSGCTDAVSGCYAAAALAGALCANTDPAAPLHGQVLHGLTGVCAAYQDSEYDALANGGVTVLECEGGEVSVIRALTTRTKTGGVRDVTYHELSTMLIIDDVIPAIRTSLRAHFVKAKNNAATRKSIRNRVIMELEDRMEREILESYGNVAVESAANDRSVCEVSFEMAVMQGLSRIHLTAHISV